MVRKYFIEQVLAKCKGFVKVLLGLFILGSFSACDQEMSEPVPQVAKVVDSLQTDPATRSSARSLETTSPGWSEGSYDAFIASKYTIPTPVRIQSDYYKFRVVPADGNTIEVWIKYFSPQGNIVYQQMERRGSSFEIQRIFQQEGKYSYAFFVKRIGSVGYPRISQQGLSVNVELPVPLDDYPWPNGNSSTEDSWGFYKRWCTSWVAFKVNQMWKTDKGFFNGMYGTSETNKLGNASHWLEVLSKNGYSHDLEPQVGDIAWWRSNHVAFVYRIIDRNTVIITEYNNPSANKSLKYHWRYLYRGKSFPNAFIHVQKKK